MRLLYSLCFLVTLFLLAMLWVTTSRSFGQDKPPQTQEEKQARQDLNQGVQAFKNGQYQEAERYFWHAKQLDQGLLNARLYLRRPTRRSTSPVRRAMKTFARGTPRSKNSGAC